MKQKKRKNKSKIVVFIIIFSIIIISLLGYCAEIFYQIGYNQADQTEEVHWLKDKLIVCYDDLKEYTPHCITPSDCFNNNTQTGCLNDGCNWCCYDVCTLMRCIDNKKVKYYENFTLLIPHG